MAFNPWTARPKDAQPHKRTFHDADQDADITLTFRRLSVPGMSQAADQGDRLIREFVTGDEATGDGPKPLPALSDGTAIPVSQTLLRNAAMIEAMQPLDATERYDAMQLIAMSAVISLDTWKAIVRFATQVNGGDADALKNALGAATETSSERPSATTSDTLS